ncbi:MAG: TetR family transcriptional regulator [Actinomycetota bacterium]
MALPADDLTRARLLEAAAEVFSERGYDRAGVQEISRRAGFTTGAIYGRFSGKADLLLEAIRERCITELDELFANHEFADHELERRLPDILNTAGAHLATREPDPDRALLLEAFVAGRRETDMAGAVRQVVEERSGRLAQVVEEAKASGLIDADIDTRSIVRFCHALGLGFLLYEAVDLERPDAEAWEHLINRLVAALSSKGE